MTSEGHAFVRFQRALERRNLIAAETAAYEIPLLPLEDVLRLVYLYADKRDPKYERAALRYLERYLTEAAPSLLDVAGIAALLAERKPAHYLSR